jgi:hypothetical protein
VSTQVEKKTTLYDLIVNAQLIVAALVESGGEITPDIDAALNTHQLALSAKVDSYAFVEDQLETQARVLKEREETVYKIRKGLENARERLRQNLKNGMKAMEMREILGNEFKYAISERKPRIVFEESLVPDQYKYVVHQTLVDTEALLTALNRGESVPGARLEPVIALTKRVNVKGAKG